MIYYNFEYSRLDERSEILLKYTFEEVNEAKLEHCLCHCCSFNENILIAFILSGFIYEFEA